MILTRKAAVGFILLAAIVFLMAYYATPTPKLIPSTASAAQLIIPPEDQVKTQSKEIKEVVQYHSPLVSFRSQWEAAITITAIIESFALVCYLTLKKLEPAINKAAERSMQGLKESIRNIPEEHE